MGDGAIGFNLNERIFLAVVGAAALLGYYFVMRALWKDGNYMVEIWTINKTKQPRLFRAFYYIFVAGGVLGVIGLVLLVT